VNLIILLAGSILAIVIGAELFTNAVEWAGYLLQLGTGATGSLLAALGTSLPETIVPVVAIIANRPHSTAIATGAVLGSSFMLLSLGTGITGIAVMVRHLHTGSSSNPCTDPGSGFGSDPGPYTDPGFNPDTDPNSGSDSDSNPSTGLQIPPSQSRRDLGVFLVAFSMSLLIMPLPFAAHLAWGVCLIILYSIYVIATLKNSTPTGKTPEPLHITLRKKSTPHWVLVALQLSISIALLIVGSDIFVSQIGKAATTIQMSPLLLALIAIPLATEFPETLNSILWVRSRADSLAFGNVAGSAAFQSCILGFIAVSFTPWQLPTVAIISAVFTICTGAYLLLVLRNGHSRGIYLLLAALPWVSFVTLELSLNASSITH